MEDQPMDHHSNPRSGTWMSVVLGAKRMYHAWSSTGQAGGLGCTCTPNLRWSWAGHGGQSCKLLFWESMER